MKKLIFLVIILCLSVCSYASENVVTLATLTDFAPYCFSKDNGTLQGKEIVPPGTDSVQLQGYSWEVIRESFHAAGYTIELYVLPWARVLHFLQSNKVDAIFPANRTEEREEDFVFSEQYVDRIRIVAYATADSPIVWQGLKSLEGLSVGAVRGWAYGKQWEQNHLITKEPMDTVLQSFQVLEKKRLDAVIGYEIAYDYVLKRHGIQRKFKKLGGFSVVEEYLMGKRNNLLTQEKIDAFDRGRRLVEQSGELDAIGRKWQ